MRLPRCTRHFSPAPSRSEAGGQGRLRLPRRLAAGFTLIEILVVIGIISILMGLVMGAIASARRTARVNATNATITLLKGMLDRYEGDFHDYPPSDGDGDGIKGSESLYKCLRTDKKEGPYITEADVRVLDTNGNGEFEIADGFNKPLRYLHHKDYGNRPPNKRTFRIISSGVNGEYEEGSKDSDDIVNWDKNRPE